MHYCIGSSSLVYKLIRCSYVQHYVLNCYLMGLIFCWRIPAGICFNRAGCTVTSRSKLNDCGKNRLIFHMSFRNRFILVVGIQHMPNCPLTLIDFTFIYSLTVALMELIMLIPSSYPTHSK